MPKRYFRGPVIVLFLLLALSAAVSAQALSEFDRQRGQMMLKGIISELKSKYYDTTFRGIDLDARATVANEKMKTATSNGQIMGIIAQVLIEFNDSHTRFIPPSRASQTEYGWTMRLIGNGTYVVAVKPGSDAAAKGLKVGDRIVAIDGTAVVKENLWVIKYLYYSLRPQPGMRLTIQRPGATKEEEVVVMAKITVKKKLMDLTSGNDIFDLIREEENEDRLNRHRYLTLGDSVMIWKMPQFDLSETAVDDLMEKAQKHEALILDLRGNGGGMVLTLNRLIANLFDRDIRIADWKGRKKFDPQIAKTRGKNAYTGKLIVLIDSASGSAAEILARVVQLEKRGTVLGDVSSGKVMVSRYYSRQVGMDTVVFYGASITEADLIMSDGKSIENVGVTPDKYLIPTQKALAENMDPVLSFAAGLLGKDLDPIAAGKMFPIEWGN